MAKQIPARGSCLGRMTNGEKRFSERLEQKLEDEYLIWYDVPVGPKYRKPDFVLLHPRRGVLILEVKDWKLETIQSFDRDSFALLTNRGLVREKSPLAQARVYALEVADVLARDPQLRHAENSPRAGKLIASWGFGVVLANISRAQFDDTNMKEVLPEHLVICQDEFMTTVDAEALQTRLWAMFPWTFPCLLGLPQIDRIRWHLFPQIRVLPDTGQFGLFASGVPRETRIEIPDIVRVMNLQQEELARALGDGHRVIHGVAGSGKTMILGYRCVKLARELDKPILVLCYNKTLAARLEQLIGESGLQDKVQIYNFHAWCSAQIRFYGLVAPQGAGVFERMIQTVIDGVDSGMVPRAQYGAVLIDEGHDFEPDWYKLVVQMVDPATKSLLVLYDDAQNIYGKETRRKFTWKSVGVEAVGHTTILRVNYRNTLEILAVAQSFALEVMAAHESDDDGIPLISPESAGRRGSVPMLLRAQQVRGDFAATVELARKYIADGRSPSDIAVIYRRQADGEELHRLLIRAGIPARISIQRGKGTLFHGDPSVKVVSMHSSKGLEFPVVIIPRIGDMPGPKEDPRLEARLLYVAMTRATEDLTLLYDQPSVFTERLEASVSSPSARAQEVSEVG